GLILPAATAQDASTGAIYGTVADASGGMLAWASIVLVNNGTGLRYSTATDGEGHFAFQLLPPGDYSARAELRGMSPQLAPNLHVEVGGTLQLAFVLQVAGVKETVTVSEAPQTVETQPSAISSYLDERAITDLPLNGRRYTDLALLGGGVT